MTEAARGLVIAAPHSGSGKTVVTLALLRALARGGERVVSAKVGPDYIDPKFHEAASGAPCVNLDAWAMRPELLLRLAHAQAERGGLMLIEGVMGLYDGAADGAGSTAEVAARLDLPVVLVVDVARQAQSVAALVRGFRDHGPARIAGVILNRIGSPRHEAILNTALAPLDIPVLGTLPRDPVLTLPERHLGLVPAGEHDDLDGFLDAAADRILASIDLACLADISRPLRKALSGSFPAPLAPLGQRMAIARDVAFAFTYPHLLDGWRRQGAELTFFSPLADEAPPPEADAIFLPGGYPELHAGQLAGAENFLGGLREAARSGTRIYGECGGYMVLGETLTDADGTDHAMAGLLPLQTSFATRKLHLGYRRLSPRARTPWRQDLRAHEFHYASVVSERGSQPLFDACDALGEPMAPMGLRIGEVMGSFAHVVDMA